MCELFKFCNLTRHLLSKTVCILLKWTAIEWKTEILCGNDLNILAVLQWGFWSDYVWELTIKGLPLACVFSCLSYSFEGTGELFQIVFAQQKVRGLVERKASSSSQKKREGQQLNKGRNSHKYCRVYDPQISVYILGYHWLPVHS